MDKVTFFDIYEAALCISGEPAQWPPAVVAWYGENQARIHILNHIQSNVTANADYKAVPLIHEVLASVNQEPSA